MGALRTAERAERKSTATEVNDFMIDRSNAVVKSCQGMTRENGKRMGLGGWGLEGRGSFKLPLYRLFVDPVIGT